MTSKIALITGGSRGLGKNTALAMAKQGMDVVLTYHSKQAAALEVVEEIAALGRKAVALQLDVAQVKTFDAFAQTLKQALQIHFQAEKFDFLVNNAGTGLTAPFAETTEQIFDDMVNIHLKSTFFVTQKLLPLINDGGRIINISSGLARFTLPGYSAYAAMKGGIEVLTRYMAKELGARQIAVNTVAPGAIETDFGQGLVRDNKEVNAYIASQTALGRVGVPDDIGPMIASLLSENNRWVNAQRIEASGGMLI
ncbi:SDR family NAD(P)-dependent oxidoreductase [Aeromonas caviae]|uniref:SDR family NAD(P)-dependent oxidoreductase n=1 Tax=Aeromonas caviae TaxID=648 RepID=UPI001FBB9C56|nr:SDR family oxidoreductase [Aeromonas caviae]GKR01804.1 short-chain dehydrogenase [Aeromonas caviae]GKR11961.1 short-chain dehydrogenase [Aeromonas caviae]GKR16205.1 short-chain dehydrogenase [Aeromonas caviae]GKR20421.1 short-chain dehydrogenase [Aeromonas caviae]GKR24635.1 short-chain dehydrogenase [Aeromonas caviae]